MINASDCLHDSSGSDLEEPGTLGRGQSMNSSGMVGGRPN